MAGKPSVSRAFWGTYPSKEEEDEKSQQTVELLTLRNRQGTEVVMSTLGLAVQRFCLGGTDANIVLSSPSLEAYLKQSVYLGATVGRYCNRVAYGRLRVHDKVCQLDCNTPPHHLHGGHVGFDQRIWKIEKIEVNTEGYPTLVAELVSKDSDQGYPGNLTVTTAVVLTDDNQLRIDFTANTDQSTHVNLTNHTYFNLSGTDFGSSNGTESSSGSACPLEGHFVRIHSQQYTEMDEDGIPTGKVLPVKDTPLDFINWQSLADRATMQLDHPLVKNRGGLDHNFVFLTKNQSSTTRVNEMKLMAEVYHQDSGLQLSLSSTQPGMQLYSGQGLAGTPKEELMPSTCGIKNSMYDNYEAFSGFCLEPQHFPDTPNHDEFPSTILEPNNTYRHRICYHLSRRQKT